MVVVGKLLLNVYIWQMTSKQYHFNYRVVIVKIGLGISEIIKNVVELKSFHSVHGEVAAFIAYSL